MYNLFVSGNEDDWRDGPFELEMSRVGEFTVDSLKTKYSRMLDDGAMEEIKLSPALFAYERTQNLGAKIGWITEIRINSGKVRIKYEFAKLPPISVEKLEALRWELDIQKWEMNRTHWAFKDVDFFQALIDAGLIDSKDIQVLGNRIGKVYPASGEIKIEVHPKVFRVPEAEPDSQLVSVMMPFGKEFDDVYHAIARGCKNKDLKCLRAKDVWKEDVVVDEIFSLIYRSKVVICDFTGCNSNVFYETGIAHTLGRDVIPVVQNEADVPFNLRHIRYIRYLNNSEGQKGLEEEISDRLETITGKYAG